MSSFALFLLIYVLFFHRRRRIEYWNGPTPSQAERRKTLQFIEKYLYDNPTSGLRDDYPEIAKKNMAAKRYLVITQLWESGKMDAATYEMELEKILPLIDITEDVKK